ncbi:hypothetical protein OKA06_18795 [Novosphingobium sp. MW5]|nr:hypothetical protein [Novosphingobium sp. MW5]
MTRERMYLETMERVLGGMNLTILDNVGGSDGQGVVPYLPLDMVRNAPSGTSSRTTNQEQLMKRLTLFIPVLVIAVALALSSVFIVDERETCWCCSSVRSNRSAPNPVSISASR